MLSLNIESLRKKLPTAAFSAMANMLSDEKIVNEINRAWNDEAVNKIHWKAIKKIASPGFDDLKEENREGYYSVIFLRNPEMQREPYLIGQKFDAGGKAILKNGYNLSTGEHVALRIVRNVTDDLQTDEYRRTQAALAVVGRLRGSLERENKRYIAEEFISGSNLSNYSSRLNIALIRMKDRTEEFLGLYKSIVDLMYNTLKAVVKFREAGFIHRDIKPTNFMVIYDDDVPSHQSRVTNVVIIDFGGAGHSPGEPRSSRFGSVDYMAPEIAEQPDDATLFSLESDAYAVGKTLQSLEHMLTANAIMIGFRLLKKDLQLPYLEANVKIKEVITGLLNSNPSERLTVESACNKMNEIIKSDRFGLLFKNQDCEEIKNEPQKLSILQKR